MSVARALIWSGDRAFRRATRQLLTQGGFAVVASSRGLLRGPDAELLLVDIDALPHGWWRDISALRMRNRSVALILASDSWLDFARLRAWRPCGYVRKPLGLAEVTRVLRALVPNVAQQAAPPRAA